MAANRKQKLEDERNINEDLNNCKSGECDANFYKYEEENKRRRNIHTISRREV